MSHLEVPLDEELPPTPPPAIPPAADLAALASLKLPKSLRQRKAPAVPTSAATDSAAPPSTAAEMPSVRAAEAAMPKSSFLRTASERDNDADEFERLCSAGGMMAALGFDGFEDDTDDKNDACNYTVTVPTRVLVPNSSPIAESIASAATYVACPVDTFPGHRADAHTPQDDDDELAITASYGGAEPSAEDGDSPYEIASPPSRAGSASTSPAGSETYISFGVGSDCNVPSELERSMFDLEASMIQYMPTIGDSIDMGSGWDADYVSMDASQLLNDEIVI